MWLFTLLPAAGLLGACSSTLVTLKNPQTGEVATCKTGVMQNGVTPKPVEEALLTKCVDGYTQQGYDIVATSK
jgi:hypothetical protein